MNSEESSSVNEMEKAYADALAECPANVVKDIETHVDNAMQKCEFMFHKMKGYEQLMQLVAMGISIRATKIILTIEE